MGELLAALAGPGGDPTALPPQAATFRHVGARYYAPPLGRFAMRDPIGVAGGMNVYGYVNQTPPIGVDPTGTEFSAAGVTTAAGVGGLIGGLSSGMASGVWSWSDAGKGFVGGAVSGAVSLFNPLLGGAAGNFVSGLLSGDSWLGIATETAFGAGIPAWIGSWASEGFTKVEGALVDIVTTECTNDVRQAAGGNF